MNEYIIVNKTDILKRIKELNALSYGNKNLRIRDAEGEAIEELENILSRSTPLIPEIDKSIQFGKDIRSENSFIDYHDYDAPFIGYDDTTTETNDYINNLKLDI